jgi:hypothetical protein
MNRLRSLAPADSGLREGMAARVVADANEVAFWLEIARWSRERITRSGPNHSRERLTERRRPRLRRLFVELDAHRSSTAGDTN